MASLIRFTQATLGYGKKAVLRDISFSIEAGEYFGLVGPNGAGKTTIVRTILGSLKPLAGAVDIARLNDHALRFGYVPQRDTVDTVLPYTTQEVVMMGRFRQRGYLRRPGPTDRKVVADSLAHVRLEDAAKRPFKDLSGGQKQRALIARALATEPDMLVLDEPTNGMDLASRTSILNLISELHQENSMTVLLVSHLLDDVARSVDRLAVVEREVFSVGTVEEVLTAGNLTMIYGMPVTVERIQGQTIVLTGGAHGTH
jgi:ABC-type Mn2+/Zn2+ transport system ATPase subunit